MGVSRRACNALFVVVALWGCAKPGKAVAKTFFCCGCDACAAFMNVADPSLVSQGEVIFRGGPGDAEEFRTRFHLATHVVSDFDGSLFAANGIQTCPAVIVAGGRGQALLGNGARLDPQAIRRAEERMSP